MSLPWNKTVVMQVEAHQVSATLRQGWPRAKTVATVVEWVDPVRADAAAAAATSQAINAALPLPQIDAALKALQQSGSLAGAHLQVELSDAWVHLDVIDGDFVGNSQRQLDAIAQACVAELLGEIAGDFEVRSQLQGNERHLLISAISRAHIASLGEVAQQQAMKLHSLAPRFVGLWNRHAQPLAKGPGVFAVTTGAHVAVAFTTDGVIQALSTGALMQADAARDAAALAAEEAAELAAEQAEQAQRAARTARDARQRDVEQLESRIDTMLSDFGLAAQRRTLAAQVHGWGDTPMGLLDRRVDQLLATLGQDAQAQAAFVLVASDVPGFPTATQPNTYSIRKKVA